MNYNRCEEDSLIIYKKNTGKQLHRIPITGFINKNYKEHLTLSLIAENLPKVSLVEVWQRGNEGGVELLIKHHGLSCDLRTAHFYFQMGVL